MVKTGEIIAFVLYFVLVIAVGVYFYLKGKGKGGVKTFFLGGRKMSGIVSALSAGASDMSAWSLMGLPGAIYLYGVGQVWISIGLAIGTILAWILVAPKLRRYSILAKDSITIPQYLTNRFFSNKKSLQIVCGIIFLVVYCIYGASSINACGTLFYTLFGLDARIAMAIATVIIIFYVFLGGYNAVCWTDFFQGMIMLVALMLTPIVCVALMNGEGIISSQFVGTPVGENFYNLLSSGKLDWKSVADILTGLGWGLGYFGMPHIIVRYIGIKSEKEMVKSKWIGSFWTTLILIFATVVALVARKFFSSGLEDSSSTVFITMAREVFPVFIGGLLITAVIAASMSTADSQLLASSSAFASDIYKAQIKKDATDKQVLLMGRITVVAVSIIAFLIAFLGAKQNDGTIIVPAFSTIMSLVSAAWAAFGSSFAPVILLSLYWRRLNYKGATAGIVIGFIADILWMVLFNMEYYSMTSVVAATGLYEIIPGFIFGLLSAIVVSYLTGKPDDETLKLFDILKGCKGIEVDGKIAAIQMKNGTKMNAYISKHGTVITNKQNFLGKDDLSITNSQIVFDFAKEDTVISSGLEDKESTITK